MARARQRQPIPPDVKNQGGRPSAFKNDFVELGHKYALLGLTDKQMADLFGVSEQTLNAWKKEHPEFFESLKTGKDEADSVIASSLYHRAKGYSHPDVHITNFQGQITITPITKHYPPDTTAAIFWLKNRQPEKWRDKREMEHSGAIELEVKDAGRDDLFKLAASRGLLVN